MLTQPRCECHSRRDWEPFSFRSFSRETRVAPAPESELQETQVVGRLRFGSCVLRDTAVKPRPGPTGNLETPGYAPRSELSCEKQRSAGYKSPSAGSIKMEIRWINVIRTSHHISRGRKTPWTGQRSITGHTPLVPRVGVCSQSSTTTNKTLMENIH